MDNLFYDLAIQMSNMTKYLKSGDEYGARNASLIAKNVAQKIPDTKPYSKFQANLIFVEVLNFLALEGSVHDASQRKCLSMLKDIYGDQHVVLSDICKTTRSFTSLLDRFCQIPLFRPRG